MEEKKARKKRKLGSYPFVSVIFSVTLALLVLGLFGWILLHSSKLSSQIQENLELQVFLNKNLSKSEINKIQSQVSSGRYILEKEGVAQVVLTTKEQAAEEFMEATGEDFKQFLGDNPLRDLLSVRIKGGYQNPDSLAMIKNELSGLRGIFEVNYEESLVESINQNLAKISLILIGVAVFALIVVVVLINNTIKLALFSQRFLIRSMQLVGATKKFIQRPFLIRSVMYGMMGGLLASLLLYSFSFYMNSIIEGLSELLDFNSILLLYVIIPLTGAVVGYFSSLRAMNKYLNMSLDELY